MSGNVQRISVGVTLNGQKYTLFCFSSYDSKQNTYYKKFGIIIARKA